MDIIFLALLGTGRQRVQLGLEVPPTLGGEEEQALVEALAEDEGLAALETHRAPEAGGHLEAPLAVQLAALSPDEVGHHSLPRLGVWLPVIRGDTPISPSMPHLIPRPGQRQGRGKAQRQHRLAADEGHQEDQDQLQPPSQRQAKAP